MRWVTKEKISYERIGAAWLITRFIDPQAEFRFVPDGTDAATIKDGTPFHLDNAELRNRPGKGTFQNTLEHYDLVAKHPLLGRFAELYNAAYALQKVMLENKGGSVRKLMAPTAPPETAGLQLAIQGLRQIAKDDVDLLVRSGAVLDAFYAGMPEEAGLAAR